MSCGAYIRFSWDSVVTWLRTIQPEQGTSQLLGTSWSCSSNSKYPSKPLLPLMILIFNFSVSENKQQRCVRTGPTVLTILSGLIPELWMESQFSLDLLRKILLGWLVFSHISGKGHISSIYRPSLHVRWGQLISDQPGWVALRLREGVISLKTEISPRALFKLFKKRSSIKFDNMWNLVLREALQESFTKWIGPKQ